MRLVTANEFYRSVCFDCCAHMCFCPKGCRNGKRINSLVLPPEPFVAAPVQLAMMEPAQRNSEPVTDLAPESSELCKLDMVSV